MCVSASKESTAADAQTRHAPTRHTNANRPHDQHTAEDRTHRRLDGPPALVLNQLTDDQRQMLTAIVSRLDTHKDSVVLTNPLVSNGPIVHVTEAWQQMCGYKASEALGRNPKVTQGAGTDKSVLASMRLALQEQRPCKVRLLN